MPLILAVEPDRRQAAHLTNVVRQRVGAELVLAETTELALASIGNRVPDLILVPALLSPQDDAALAAALRVIATAAHVQMLTTPMFGAARPAPRRGVLAAFRRAKPATPAIDGCDPAEFAQQISSYLASAAEQRAAAEDAAVSVEAPVVESADDASDEPVVAEAAAGPEREIIAQPELDPEIVALPEPVEEVVEAIAETAEPIAEVAEPIVETPVEVIEPIVEIDEPLVALEPASLPETEPVLAVQAAVDESEDASEIDAIEVASDIHIDAPFAIEAVEDVVDSIESRHLELVEVVMDDNVLNDEEVIAADEQLLEAIATVETDVPMRVFEAEQASEASDDITAPVSRIARDALREFAAAVEAMTAIGAAPAEPGPVLDFDDLFPRREPVEPSPLGAWRSWIALEGAVAEVAETPVPAHVVVRAVERAPERPEWVQLVESLRIDVERRRNERSAVTAAAVRPKPTRPIEDEWGLFDPAQCGFAALLAKLDEITTHTSDPRSRPSA